MKRKATEHSEERRKKKALIQRKAAQCEQDRGKGKEMGKLHYTAVLVVGSNYL